MQRWSLPAHEALYVGVDIGKQAHVAGFVSVSLLARHVRFEGCPVVRFENTRDGFRAFIDQISTYVPLERCYVLMERTGHYHHVLAQYLHNLDITLYLIHVQERPKGMLKTDKRDALRLANQLYNQLDKGIQVADKLQLVRRAVPPTATAAALRSLLRHRTELVQETTQRKNKLTSIADEVFPEFTQVFKDPNGITALKIRAQFPTPHAVATTSIECLQQLCASAHVSTAKLVGLQQVAAQSIGITNGYRQHGLVLEQTQLIRELQMMQAHIAVLTEEIDTLVHGSREGRIVLSVPGWGPLATATLLASIQHIDNFPTAAAFKAYCGWAPKVSQSGTSKDQVVLGRGGTRLVKQAVFLAVFQALRLDCEWRHLYDRLVPRKCPFDERTRTYKGKMKVVGRIAGQMLSLIYGLLKHDQELLQQTLPGDAPAAPMLYDAAIHKAHRAGQYRSSKPRSSLGTVIYIPNTAARP